MHIVAVLVAIQVLLYAQVAKSYLNAREALIVNGNFLLNQLKRMDTAAGGKATFAFNSTPFVASLREEVGDRTQCCQ